jgi:hypothetical protein
MGNTLRKVKTFRRDVRCAYPLEGKSGTEDVKFSAEFRYLDRAEVTALPKRLGANEDQHLLDVVLVGVHDVKDESGQAIDPKEAAELVKADPWYCSAAVKSWTDAITGEKAKN